VGLASLKLFNRNHQPSLEYIRKDVPRQLSHVEALGFEEATLLRVPFREKTGAMGWFARKSNSPSHHEIELDEIGSFVWGLCDGKRNVAGIAAALSKHYKITTHEAEASLLDFLDSLRRRGCLTLERK
jgi:hypothetical protein